MSILTAEYNFETHMRIFKEEILEDRNIELASEMLADGEPIDKIAKWTKLSKKTIKQLIK